MTIFTKGLLMIAAPLVFQLVFVAMLINVMNAANEAEKWALHTKEVISLTEKAFGQMGLVQGASRAYVISHALPFANDEAAAAHAARSILAQLKKLTEDNPAQQKKIIAITEEAERMLQWHDEQIRWVSEGNAQAAYDRVIKLQGRDRLEELRKRVDVFLAEEEALDIERVKRLQTARSNQRLAIGGGTLMVFIASLAAAYFFGRSIAKRIDVLTRNAERLAESEALADRVAGSDEIARLDAVMHQSAKRLREAEEAETQFQRELEKRAAELAKTNESLRQQTQENEMFVYSVSHDLRSPLVNLQGFSKELDHACRDLEKIADDSRIPDDVRKQVKVLLAEDMDDSLRFIRTAVSRSSAIIDALLRLNRAGRIEYRWQVVQVTLIVERVIEAMQGSIRDKEADVTVAGELLPAWGDPTAIEQIFGNLIGNAVNYLDPKRPGKVEIGMVDGGKPDAAGLRTYYVKDNGLGIPAAYMAKVFVAFQRLHGDVARGEGIGLAVVRRMIERHGGRAWVESVESTGSTFFVALPAEKPSTVAAESDRVAIAALADPENADENSTASRQIEELDATR